MALRDGRQVIAAMVLPAQLLSHAQRHADAAGSKAPKAGGGASSNGAGEEVDEAAAAAAEEAASTSSAAADVADAQGPWLCLVTAQGKGEQAGWGRGGDLYHYHCTANVYSTWCACFACLTYACEVCLLNRAVCTPLVKTGGQIHVTPAGSWFERVGTHHVQASIPPHRHAAPTPPCRLP